MTPMIGDSAVVHPTFHVCRLPSSAETNARKTQLSESTFLTCKHGEPTLPDINTRTSLDVGLNERIKKHKHKRNQYVLPQCEKDPPWAHLFQQWGGKKKKGNSLMSHHLPLFDELSFFGGKK
ncbi:hypothetical protein CEXT_537241 [Caerostris extrusa]|uniref:Uncharacterized protein n=1 Tax=Caerostris extrusa TaxID=172846 RepID=A0AAV4S143_CAEEX|nr:hypothetical protein CEXT_537241 [Caerostris extrusa]